MAVIVIKPIGTFVGVFKSVEATKSQDWAVLKCCLENDQGADYIERVLVPAARLTELTAIKKDTKIALKLTPSVSAPDAAKGRKYAQLNLLYQGFSYV